MTPLESEPAVPPSHDPLRIAWFVSPHGFGHAARSCAVMEAAFAQRGAVEFHIFTTVPEWFFRDSLSGPFVYHAAHVDVGLVQATAVTEDLSATKAAVAEFLGGWSDSVAAAATQTASAGCRLVVSDIAPLGLAAGAAAGLPTALVESFTWDSVYEGFESSSPGLGALGRRLREQTPHPDLHIRATPAAESSLTQGAVEIGPIGRWPRTSPELTRRAIGVPEEMPLVLVTLGGVGGAINFVERLADHPEAFFVLPGMADWGFAANHLLLPTRSGYFHPDLVAASEVVVGKLGYSTLAECWAGQSPYAYVARPGFLETPSLTDWLDVRGQGIALSQGEFTDGSWLDRLPALLSQPLPPGPEGDDPARVAAEAILELAAERAG